LLDQRHLYRPRPIVVKQHGGPQREQRSQERTLSCLAAEENGHAAQGLEQTDDVAGSPPVAM
jgi:hypothetical protein